MGAGGVRRRDLLRWAGAGIALGATASCGGFSTGGNDKPAAGASSGASGSSGGGGTITFTTWGGAAEMPAFRSLAEEFRGRTGTSVDIREVPFAEALTNVDAGLASGNPPDVFRVTYNDLGIYSDRGVLLDLAPYLESGFADAFLPGLWNAVSDGSRVFGVPHHTDTSMLLYNTGAFERAGITSVPQAYDDAWTWEEFLDVARRVKERGGTQYAFGVNWQQAGAYRWMNFLSQAGGRLLGPDLKSAAVPSPEGERALSYTQGFFADGLVPPNTSTKGAYPSEIFPNGRTIAMAFAGDFLLPDFEERIGNRFEYAATFAPRDRQAATDLGGNAVVVTQGSRNRDAAAAFVKFLVEEAPMRRFCEAATVLPTRTALTEQQLDFKVRPEIMQLFVQQARAILPELVEQVTVPKFSSVNTVLVNSLERAFVNKASTGDVLRAMADGVRSAVAG